MLMEIEDYVNSESGVAWPSQQTIADALDMPQQNVSRAVTLLRKCGYLATEQRLINGRIRCCYGLTAAPPTRADGAPTYISGDVPPHIARDVTEPPPSEMPHIARDVGHHISPDVGATSPEMSGPTSPVMSGTYKGTGEGTPDENSSDAGVPGGVSTPAPARPRQRPSFEVLPEGWAPSPTARTNAMAEFRLTEDQVEHETRRFASYSRGRGTRAVSWVDEWWRWLDNVRPGGPLRHRIDEQAGGAARGKPVPGVRHRGRIEEKAAWGYTR